MNNGNDFVTINEVNGKKEDLLVKLDKLPKKSFCESDIANLVAIVRYNCLLDAGKNKRKTKYTISEINYTFNELINVGIGKSKLITAFVKILNNAGLLVTSWKAVEFKVKQMKFIGFTIKDIEVKEM